MVAEAFNGSPRGGGISTVAGAVVNLDFWVGSSGTGYIALKISTCWPHGSSGQSIDRGCEGGNVKAEEDRLGRGGVSSFCERYIPNLSTAFDPTN